MTETWQLAELEERIGYRMQDRSLLLAALTHKSYSNEHAGDRIPHSERLEFLGDAVLDLVVSNQLFECHPQLSEGELSRMRAELVSERSLASLSRQWDLGDHLRLGRGEELSGGRDKPSLLADALEAVFGAVYRDGGLAPATAVIEGLLCPLLVHAIADQAGSDHKTRLQELLQARGEVPPTYVLLEAAGPEHQKSYRVEVRSGGVAIGAGQGRSKKAAQQAAAQQALLRLEA